MKLLPCPFCGGDAKFEQAGNARQSCIVACEDCSCRLETNEVFHQGSQWNARADDASGDGARDAARYRRLRVLGCAPGYSKQLEAGDVLRFTNLDEYVDTDIKTVPSRGEAVSRPHQTSEAK